MTLGGKIRKAREDAGLNQIDLAAKVGRTQSALSQIERDTVKPDRATLILLSRELNEDFGLAWLSEYLSSDGRMREADMKDQPPGLSVQIELAEAIASVVAKASPDYKGRDRLDNRAALFKIRDLLLQFDPSLLGQENLRYGNPDVEDALRSSRPREKKTAKKNKGA